MEKYCRAAQATDENMAHAHCVLQYCLIKVKLCHYRPGVAQRVGQEVKVPRVHDTGTGWWSLRAVPRTLSQELSHTIYIYIYIYIHTHIYTQGVTGGTDQTSGGCSLC